MSEVLRQILTQGLESKVRLQYARILDAMSRDFTYLREKQDNRWGLAQAQGWNAERIEVILALNAFHRVVIGPLEAAYSIRHESGLGMKIPIVFGATLVIDRESGSPVRKALAAYQNLLTKHHVRARWLTMVRVSDILYSMSGDEDGSQE